jgi:hypothetical protein
MVHFALGHIDYRLGLFIPDHSLDLLVTLQTLLVLFSYSRHLLLHHRDLALLLDRLLLGIHQGKLLR